MDACRIVPNCADQLHLDLISGLISLAAAELFVFLVRSREFLIMIKKNDQRTEEERKLCNQGLLRSVLSEVFLFAPISSLLAFLIIRPIAMDFYFLSTFIERSLRHRTAFDAAMGIVSYGFPFAAIRRTVVKMALKTLKDFASISIQNELSNPASEVGKTNSAPATASAATGESS